MYGWTGKILHVDLTRRRFDIEKPGPDFYAHYTGGKGLGGYYLRSRAELDWDHPDMVICVFTGPLVATTAPTSGRAHLVSKSPLTGLVGDASVGGKLATRLKRAGWDGLVITGRSREPVGLEILDERIALRDASHLWGQNTDTVHAALNPQKAGLACIGPAAENGVRFASVTTDRHHSAGRSGLGLSLAAKNLKYILVNGTGRVKVADPAQLKQAREEILRLTAASPALMGPFGFTCLGTGAVYDLMDNRRMMPTDNFRRTRFEHAARLNAAAYAKAYAPKKYGCRGCHILCKKIGKQVGVSVSMPEFETMSHFTALIGSMDLDLVVAANQRCNHYGMDTISAAATLACRREVTGKDFTRDSLLALLDDMAYGRGEGRLLGQGAQRYARSMGQPACAMAAKGLELPAYDPRGAYGMALGYAVSTRGGCHLRAYPISHEIFRKPVATDRFTFSGKARIIKIAEDLNAMVDSLTACKFTFFAAGLEEYAKAYTAVTGLSAGAQDLLFNGERIYYNERIINYINGFDCRQDDLPARFFSEAGSGGCGIDMPPIDRQAFLNARAKYYKIRGLDDQGRPTREKARNLGLPWIDS
ncbi:MAG: aldehyde ferredoxin oxidoreductase C-terminal domain-containing protein [Desulfobacteraceae bacterium]|jgi:aldehyde:ferredoxin oxidoreductase